MNRVYVKYIQIYFTKKYSITLISYIVSLWLSSYLGNVVYLSENHLKSVSHGANPLSI